MLEGWEKFHEPADRIVTIGAFEHFGRHRYRRFFKMANEVLPSDGTVLHTIVRPTMRKARANGLPLTHEVMHFSQVHPGRDLPGR